MDGIIDPGRGVCIGGTRALAARFARIKTKTKPENAEEAEEAEVSWGCVAESAVISKAQEKIDRSTQPPKTSASSAASAFQGFVFWFICANLRPMALPACACLIKTANLSSIFPIPSPIASAPFVKPAVALN